MVETGNHENIELLVSEYIYPINQFGRMGQIQAVFDGSFNVKVKDQIIHFASYKGYISGHGLYLPREVYGKIRPYLKVGNRVRITDNQITFYSLQEILTFDYDEKVIDQQIDHVDTNATLISQVTQAYKEATKQGLRIGLNNQDVTFKNIQDLLIKGDFNPTNLNLIVSYLVGRGRGLTPSGDDMLVGYLSLMWQFAPERAKLLAQKLKEVHLSTTDVSRAYLLAATERHFSTPLFKYYQAVTALYEGRENDLRDLEAKISWIMKVGHTSGQDMTYGIGLGIGYLNNKAIKIES
ncbi:DUF2877 domain-containing protein [Aerococcaceae bacterium 50-4]